MNWTFNQNCQLIINDLPDHQYNLLEILVNESEGTFFTQFNRSESTWSIDIPLDGLYTMYILDTQRTQEDLDKELKKGWFKFKDWVNSPDHSVGNLELVDEVFSICKLRKCAIIQEKQAIEEFLSICNKTNCNYKSDQQSVRDILLISIFVLEHLIQQRKYSEASQIIDALGSCKTVCTNTINKNCCNG